MTTAGFPDYEGQLRARLGVVATGENSPRTGRPPFFYGGIAGLEPGDEVPFELGPVPYRHVVRVCNTLSLAWETACRAPGGGVYEVEPLGFNLRRGYQDRGTMGGDREIFGRAVVVRVLQTGVRGEGGPVAETPEFIPRENALTGYRAWPICGAPADGLLTTYEGGYEFPMWQPGVNHLGCAFDHPAGSPGCTVPGCGAAFYLSLDQADSGRTGSAPYGVGIYAAVRGWGRTSKGTESLPTGDCRTEFGELLALWVRPAYDEYMKGDLRLGPVDPATDHEWARRLADRYKIPLVEDCAELREVSAC